MFKIGIPVRPWVKRFVYYLEDADPDSHIPISQSGVVPYMAYLLLERKSLAPLDGNENISDDYSDTLMFEGPIRLLDKGKIIFRNIHVVAFNRITQRLLYETILERLKTYDRLRVKRDLKTVIYEFIDELDCADELDYHTIAKGIQRHKQSKLLRYQSSDPDIDPDQMEMF